jgi:hypothetical protein
MCTVVDAGVLQRVEYCGSSRAGVVNMRCNRFGSVFQFGYSRNLDASPKCQSLGRHDGVGRFRLVSAAASQHAHECISSTWVQLTFATDMLCFIDVNNLMGVDTRIGVN